MSDTVDVAIDTKSAYPIIIGGVILVVGLLIFFLVFNRQDTSYAGQSYAGDTCALITCPSTIIQTAVYITGPRGRDGAVGATGATGAQGNVGPIVSNT